VAGEVLAREAVPVEAEWGEEGWVLEREAASEAEALEEALEGQVEEGTEEGSRRLCRWPTGRSKCLSPWQVRWG
jgi:hypothetical protein